MKNHSTSNEESQVPEHQDDFFRQVLGTFNQKEYTDEEIAQKQQEWSKYNEPASKGVQHNDFPNYFYAGFWIRFWAFCVDMICITALTSMSIGLLFRLCHWPKADDLFSLYGFLSIVIYLAYFILMTKLNHGQTVGKMIFGIRVVGFTEEELSWQTVIIREGVVRFILQANIFLYLGYIPTIFTTRKQHVADYFAETSVVTLNTIQAFNKQAS
jgi:Predicted membrane protein/domain